MHIIIAHGDLDGVGAATIVHKTLVAAGVTVDKIDTIFCGYNTIAAQTDKILEMDKQELAKTDVHFVDITPDKKRCKKLDALPLNSLKLIDHHVTKKWVNKYSWATLDTNFCATKLVASVALEGYMDVDLSSDRANALEKFADAVNAYDLWLLDSEHRDRGEKLNRLLYFFGLYNFYETLCINSYHYDVDNSFCKKVSSVLERQEKQYVKRIISSQLMQTPYCMDGYGNTFKVLFAEKHTPMVGHAALDHPESEDLHYVVVATLSRNKCSIYARDNETDVSKIASELGGGGHPAASGFQVDFLTDVRNKVDMLLNGLNY